MAYNAPLMTWHPLNLCLPSRDRASSEELEMIRHSWKAVAGSRLGACTAPASLSRDGVLVLNAWGEEASLLLKAGKKEVLKRLHAFGGEGAVREVRWRMVPPPAAAAPPRPEAAKPAGPSGGPDLRSDFTEVCRRILER
jgi:hypothetical protein